MISNLPGNYRGNSRRAHQGRERWRRLMAAQRGWDRVNPDYFREPAKWARDRFIRGHKGSNHPKKGFPSRYRSRK